MLLSGHWRAQHFLSWAGTAPSPLDLQETQIRQEGETAFNEAEAPPWQTLLEKLPSKPRELLKLLQNGEPKFAPITQDSSPSQLAPASPQTHRNRGAPSPPWRSASVDGHIAGACPGGLGLQD